MGQILGLILLAALAIYAFQLALILLLIAGLIFRTKETLGFLLICGVFALFAAHPFVGLAGVLVIAIIALVRNARRKELPMDAPPTLIDQTDT